MRIEGFSVYMCGYVVGVATLTGIRVLFEPCRFPFGGWTWPLFGSLYALVYLPLALLAFALVRVPPALPRYFVRLGVALAAILTCVAIQIVRADMLWHYAHSETIRLSLASLAVMLLLRQTTS